MLNQRRRSNFSLNVKNFNFRLGILCVSIIGVLVLHLVLDSQYFIRRVSVYYPAYLALYFLSLFILFAIHLRFSETLIGKFWKYIGYGIIYGFLAGLISYFFGIAADIFNIKQRNPFFNHFVEAPKEYLMVILTYPMVFLKSWLYGGIVGLSMFFLFGAISRNQ